MQVVMGWILATMINTNMGVVLDAQHSEIEGGTLYKSHKECMADRDITMKHGYVAECLVVRGKR